MHDDIIKHKIVWLTFTQVAQFSCMCLVQRPVHI